MDGERKVLPTRLERELDELSRFRPADVLSYRPVEQICEYCGRKHWGLLPTCDFCLLLP